VVVIFVQPVSCSVVAYQMNKKSSNTSETRLHYNPASTHLFSPVVVVGSNVGSLCDCVVFRFGFSFHFVISFSLSSFRRVSFCRRFISIRCSYAYISFQKGSERVSERTREQEVK